MLFGVKILYLSEYTVIIGCPVAVHCRCLFSAKTVLLSFTKNLFILAKYMPLIRVKCLHWGG